MFTIEGYLESKVTYQKYNKKNKNSNNNNSPPSSPPEPMILYDASSIQVPKKIVRPVWEQEPNESRRVWHKCTYAIRNHDYDTASIEKKRVEDEKQKEKAIKQAVKLLVSNGVIKATDISVA